MVKRSVTPNTLQESFFVSTDRQTTRQQHEGRNTNYLSIQVSFRLHYKLVFHLIQYGRVSKFCALREVYGTLFCRCCVFIYYTSMSLFLLSPLIFDYVSSSFRSTNFLDLLQHRFFLFFHAQLCLASFPLIFDVVFYSPFCSTQVSSVYFFRSLQVASIYFTYRFFLFLSPAQLARENEELLTRCESAEDGERESIEELAKAREELKKAREESAKAQERNGANAKEAGTVQYKRAQFNFVDFVVPSSVNTTRTMFIVGVVRKQSWG